jgi:CheY-like chemotaxis protein
MAKTKTILVIEPDHDVRVQIRKELEDHGYLVVSTANGNEAIELLREMTAPSLILLSSNPALHCREKFIVELGQDQDLNSIPVLHLLRPEDLKQLLISSEL